MKARAEREQEKISKDTAFMSFICNVKGIVKEAIGPSEREKCMAIVENYMLKLSA